MPAKKKATKKTTRVPTVPTVQEITPFTRTAVIGALLGTVRNAWRDIEATATDELQRLGT